MTITFPTRLLCYNTLRDTICKSLIPVTFTSNIRIMLRNRLLFRIRKVGLVYLGVVIWGLVVIWGWVMKDVLADFYCSRLSKKKKEPSLFPLKTPLDCHPRPVLKGRSKLTWCNWHRASLLKDPNTLLAIQKHQKWALANLWKRVMKLKPSYTNKVWGSLSQFSVQAWIRTGTQPIILSQTYPFRHLFKA